MHPLHIGKGSHIGKGHSTHQGRHSLPLAWRSSVMLSIGSARCVAGGAPGEFHCSQSGCMWCAVQPSTARTACEVHVEVRLEVQEAGAVVHFPGIVGHPTELLGKLSIGSARCAAGGCLLSLTVRSQAARGVQFSKATSGNQKGFQTALGILCIRLVRVGSLSSQ